MVKGGARTWLGYCLLALLATFAGVLMLSNDVALLTTRGSSMHPNFRTGDLAITVASDHYEIGDVAAYRAEPNGAIVLHRIVASENGRFTFKGDNNGWKDPTHPRPDELVGKLWLRVPGAGVIADYTSAPGRAVLLSGGVFLLIIGGEATRRRSKRRRTSGGGGVPRPRRVPSTSELGEAGAMFALPGAAALAALLLLGLSFTRPDVRETTHKREYTQDVTYGYTGTAPSGTTYPEGTITTGAPIFLRLVQQIKFQIAYQLAADDPIHNAAGIYSIDAELSGVGSWKRTIALQASTRFSGAGFATEVTLDVPQIQAIVAATQAETGVKSGDVMIDLIPRVTTNGFAGGVPISATFDTAMRLKLTPLDITPVKQPDDTSDGLGEQTTSTYKAPVERARKMTFMGRSMNVSTVRTFSALASLAALAWLGSVAATYRKLRRGSEGARVAHRYQSTLVEVASLPVHHDPIDVAEMAALARIAERAERLILHHVAKGVHTFLVEADGSAYRHLVEDQPASPPVQHPPPTPVAPASPLPSASHPPPASAPPVFTPPPFPPPWPPASADAAGSHPPAASIEPERSSLTGLIGAPQGDPPDGAGFHALLQAAGFLPPAAPPATPPAAPPAPPPTVIDAPGPGPDEAPVPLPAPGRSDTFLGVPPPYDGPIAVGSLAEATNLTPLTDAEQAELGIEPEPRAGRSTDQV